MSLALPKFLLGKASNFSLQPYSEVFTHFAGVELELLAKDWYFFELLVNFGFVKELAPNVARVAPSISALSKPSKTQLTPEQIQIIDYWDCQALTLIQSKASDKLAVKVDALNRTQIAGFNDKVSLKAEQLPDELSDLVKQRAFLFLATAYPSKKKLTLAQLEQALSMRLLQRQLYQQQASLALATETSQTAEEGQTAQTEQATETAQTTQGEKAIVAHAEQDLPDNNNWVLVVSDQAKLSPDWLVRLESILKLLELRSFALNNAKLANAWQDLLAVYEQYQTATHTTELLSQLWTKQYFYQQQYRFALKPLVEELAKLEQYASSEDKFLYALADRLVRTQYIALDNNFTHNNSYIASQNLQLDLPSFNQASNQQELNFLHGLTDACAGMALINLSALANYKISGADLEQAYGCYATSEVKLPKLTQYQITYPQATPSLEAFTPWQMTLSESVVVAQASPALAQVITAEHDLVFRRELAQTYQNRPGFNYSGSYVGKGYDHLATFKQFVVGCYPASKSSLNALNQLAPADVNSFLVGNREDAQLVWLGEKSQAEVSQTEGSQTEQSKVVNVEQSQAQAQVVANAQASRVIRLPNLGDFYRQTHTLNFVPLNLPASLLADPEVARGDFFAPAGFKQVCQQLSQEGDLLEDDYIFIAQVGTRFVANWYNLLNQQLTKVFLEQDQAPGIIKLGSAYLVRQKDLVQLDLAQAYELETAITLPLELAEPIKEATPLNLATANLATDNLTTDNWVQTKSVELTAPQFAQLEQDLHLTKLQEFVSKEQDNSYQFNFTQLIEKLS
ncbi:hypothetical protein CKF54_01190 [Psittacicella hinzii]|uniref:Uncharacterized protein n=2 Tax=Psittacicella hinzii TaxID=2028575 RepID=A0A3A1Y7G9_9GAMM|nr:hypothetical protein CKF54_01190 [Psittacicella hinzii]